jgi:hypothetical protein
VKEFHANPLKISELNDDAGRPEFQFSFVARVSIQRFPHRRRLKLHLDVAYEVTGVSWFMALSRGLLFKSWFPGGSSTMRVGIHPKEGDYVCNSGPAGANGRRRGISILILCLLVLTTPSFAQSGDSDTGEVAAFGGGVFGIGTHAAVGASSGVAFSKYGIGLIEVAFSPLGDQTVRRRIGPRPENSKLFDFNFSVHIRIPVKQRFAPYAIVGGGLLFDKFKVVPTVGPPPETGEPPTVQPAFSVDEANFGFHTGGGARYYIREDWGIRPEFKVIVSNRTYTRFTVGIFYTLPAGGIW